MSAHHGFDPEIATLVGCNAAVIYQNIKFWCAKNAANGRNEHEGRHYTYNSIKAFGELFPYLTEKQIRSALDRLESEGLIGVACLNKSNMDRTKWYCLEGRLELPQRANGFAPEGEPIPDSKPYNISTNVDIYTSITPKDALEVWNEVCVPAGLAKPRAKLPAKRAAALKARLRDEGLDVWREACKKLVSSSFCRGENNTGWKADIDFLASESGFAKVMEGKYDDGPGGRGCGPRNATDAKLASSERQLDAWVRAAEIDGPGDGGGGEDSGQPPSIAGRSIGHS